MSFDDKEKSDAKDRAKWPVKVRRLGEDDDDLSATTTPEERLAMMWPLALEAWSVAGKPIPDYDRSNMPSRVIRGYLNRERDEP